METFLSDVRYAVRTWIRNPAFAAVAVLTLSLGIGANTTMFSVVNATLLQPLPYPDPDRLVTVWKGRFDNPRTLSILSMPNYRDWRAQNHVFQELAIFDSAGRGYNLTSGGEPEQVSGLRVTAGFFSVLGVSPMLGRTFLPDEEEPGRAHVVVLSHGLWTRRYNADPALVGSTIQIDGSAFTVVGVMPPDFVFQFWSGPRQLWVPAGWTRGDQSRGANSFISIARLKPGVALDDARSEMDVIGRRLAAVYPNDNPEQTIRVVPMSEYSSQTLRAPLYTILGVVGFVLLIACVNVANLMLARAATRSRELAIRRALGAGRRRLVRQLLTESVLLACVGGVCGLLLAYWGTRLSVAILPNYLKQVPAHRGNAIGLDATVLLFTFGVSIVSGLLFGVAPALASFLRDGHHPLTGNERGPAGGRSRLRYGLVASEVALTLVVLAGAGMMILSVGRLLGVDPGLDPRNVLVMQMSLPQEDLYNGPPDHRRFCDDLSDRVGGIPGVVSASAIAHVPLSGGGAGRGLTIEGRPDPGPMRQAGAGYSVACPNILRTLGISLMAGREFTPRDTVDAPGVVLINERMATRFWPDENAVGKRFKIGNAGTDSPWLTVVGVFRNIRHAGLENDPTPSFLRPYAQAGWPSMSVMVKTASAPAAFVTPIKSALAAIEPNQPVSSVRTMEEIVGNSVAGRRFPMILLSGFALLALVLSAVGIAGVVGYSVAQRTAEIGVRMALGAQTRDVLGLVIGDSLSWTLAGVAAGVIASFGLLQFLRTLLFGVTPTDPFVLGSVSILLVGVALGASYIPARQAMRVDPVTALRRD